MAWVKLDDQARHHRKILAVGPTAAWLWTCGLMYCNSQKARDGFIPAAAVPVLYPISNPKREVDRLVSNGLWTPIEGGFVVHDYHDYQPSAEVAEATSRTKAEAGRIGGLRSGETRRSKLEAEPKHGASKRNEADAKQDASSKTKPVPIPSRPDPDLEDQDPHTPAERGLVLVNPGKPADPIARAFDRYLELRKLHRPNRRSTVMSPEGAKRAKAWLKSGCSNEDLILACEGLFMSSHHLGQNEDRKDYLEFHHAFGGKVFADFVESAAAERRRRDLSGTVACSAPTEPFEPMTAEQRDAAAKRLAEVFGDDELAKLASGDSE